MEFFINKKSTLPKLKMELINDGRNDFYKFHEKIQNANIYFTMTNIVDGVKKISKKPASIEQIESSIRDEFYIVYQFTEKETINHGKYIGFFEIEFLDGYGNLKVPIREDLFINILESPIKK